MIRTVIIALIIISLVLAIIAFITRNEHATDVVKKDVFIPKDIILTWKDNNVPPYVFDNWKRLNPDYNIKFFNDNDVIKFLRSHYSEKYVNFFKAIKGGKYKADFFRYCYLYKHGGCYMDIDIEPILPIKDIKNDEATFTTCLNGRHNTGEMRRHIFQAIIISTKNNPILKLCIDSMFHYGPDFLKTYPDIPPYWGHPTKCMYDNIAKVMNVKDLEPGIIKHKDQCVFLGTEVLHKERYEVYFNGKLWGYSHYLTYPADWRKNGDN